ncbi:MAG: tRNA lysidine(34) synthetase TilS, partial [Rhodothermales bacterium]|nr:tRNA lysidine(34) synthetase TilS [Rhodothermales bacterium]
MPLRDRPLRDRFRAFVRQHTLLPDAGPVVVGVSGGVDSMVLLHLLRAEAAVVAAHVNYRLRPEADADEAFVRAQCAAWGVPLEVRRVEEGLRGASVQARARAVRYGFFGDVAEAVGAAVIATGHHRTDQAETFLLHLLRGAGPAGLAGMPVRRPLTPESPLRLVRPLLFAARSEVVAYARAEGLAWREDASNDTADYRRNVLRREVLPVLEAHFGPGATGRIAEAAERLRAYLDAGAALAPDEAFARVGEERAEGGALDIGALLREPVVVRRGLLLEALRRWAPAAPRSSATVEELEALLAAQPGRRVAWPGVSVWRERDRLLFDRTPELDIAPRTVQPGQGARLPWGTLRVEAVSAGVPLPTA